MIALMGQRRRLCGVVVTCHNQDATQGRSPRRIRVFKDIAAAVYPGPFAVPQAKNALVLRALKQIDLLRAPNRSRSKVLVDAGLKHDVVLLQTLSGFPKILIEAA